MKIVIATHNHHKTIEMGAQLAPLGVQLAAMPKMQLPPETGATFAENASVKAVLVARATGLYTIGDDSGLCVDALGGEPGVHSARFAGTPTNDRANNEKLLAALATQSGQRSAHFVCALAIAGPDGKVDLVEGRVDGVILSAPRGKGGFGYDPIFYIPEVGRTMAELGPIEKGALSHRGRAVRLAILVLQRIAGSMK